MAKPATRILMTATSYPRSDADWQGLFIRRIADTMGACPGLELALWAPDGPRHAGVEYACSDSDSRALARLSGAGGIAHLLRSNPLRGAFAGAGLLRRLRALYRERQQHTDIFHINWLQNALPLVGMNARAVITVLGTDFKLLKLPGMVPMMRRVLRSNSCVLAPNAAWMKPELERRFGDLAPVHPVNFGIEDRWYQVQCAPPGERDRWLCVLRVTADKIGPLFDWGQPLFTGPRELHLFGPNQDGLDIPAWVHYHGAVTADELAGQWYPSATGFITLSGHSEGKPQVLLETRAAGMPVIASRIPAHEETIEHGRHGYLVDSAQALAQSLEQLRDQSLHGEMSAHCRADSAAEYGTWQDCLARYQQLYGMLA